MVDTPEPGFLGQQMQRLITEVSSLRDDMGVMMAMMMRMDGTMQGHIAETRAITSQQSRLANRVRALENQTPAL